MIVLQYPSSPGRGLRDKMEEESARGGTYVSKAVEILLSSTAAPKQDHPCKLVSALGSTTNMISAGGLHQRSHQPCRIVLSP